MLKKSSHWKPLITVITAVYNGEKYLEECIQSLHKQNYDNIEHIIVDGGSNDKTLEIIRKYEKIDYWISEKDKGIYDAFNKGMKFSTGDYLGFLNSDDVYTNEAFDYLLKYINKNPETDFFLVQ